MIQLDAVRILNVAVYYTRLLNVKWASNISVEWLYVIAQKHKIVHAGQFY